MLPRKLVRLRLIFGNFNEWFCLTGSCFFCYAVNMKIRPIFCLFCLLLFGCASVEQTAGKPPRYRVRTERETPYYLSTEAEQVKDTCPDGDIMTQYQCKRKEEDGFSCFDVYMVQGRPANTQEYTLLQQRVERQNVSPQPQCPANMQPDCASFLKALNYNLEFSWYLVDFPSSSFPQCRETYDCKRIDCYLPAADAEHSSTLVSCVYKRNQRFFVGSQITCRHAVR